MTEAPPVPHPDEGPRDPWPTRAANAVRAVLLASLQRENLTRLRTFWAAVFGVALIALLWPVFLAPGQGGSSDPEGQISALSAAEKAQVRKATPVETRTVAALGFAASPLTPPPPPAQGAPALTSPALFGVPADRKALFEEMARGLNLARPGCARWIGAPDPAEVRNAGAEAAREKMRNLTQGSTRERGVYNYHQGLIELCGPNAASAKDDFKTALKTFSDYRKSKGGALGTVEKQRLAQYETLSHYGLGLALIADSKHDPAAVDREFLKAIEAARGARAYLQAGPFVEFRTTDCGGAGRDGCDLFDFSTADVFNARLVLWMAAREPAKGFERTAADLAGAPQYLAANPTLAANFALAAAAAGRFDVASAVYAAVRDQLRAQTSTAWTGEQADPRPRVRLAAVAATTSGPVYDDNDRLWWPASSKASKPRQTFDAKGFDRATWFPAVALDDDYDAASVDLWLWVRRERALLETAAFDAFRTDGASIRTLGPGDREFLETWRRQVTGRLGEALLDRAERVRRANGLRAAAPLLRLTGSGDFPWWVRTKARLSLRANASPEAVLIADGALLAVILLLAWTHLELAAGYRRTFTRRHYDQRSAFEASASP